MDGTSETGVISAVDGTSEPGVMSEASESFTRASPTVSLGPASRETVVAAHRVVPREAPATTIA